MACAKDFPERAESSDAALFQAGRGAIYLARTMWTHLLLAVTLAQTPAPNPEPRREALAPQPGSLGELFARAQRDPAAVVPLLVAASAEIERLAPRDAVMLADTLEPFARRAFFGPERLAGMDELGLVIHTVAKGELPSRIAARKKVGAGMLAYLNDGYDEKKLRVGQELKLVDLSKGDLEIVVERSVYRLYAWTRDAHGRRVLVMCVPVGLGAANSGTPAGKTTITKRVLHPEWTHPVTHKVYPDGDPGNVLGGYWIALDAAGIGKSGIGLHGFTGDAPANWIEQPASNGCVRMLQPDIDRVFQLAIEGTNVEIR